MLSMLDSGVFPGNGFAPYQQALERLQVDAPPMDSALAMRILHAELGSGAAILADVDPAPMAAASIGQVHRGVLRDGRDVVVKIQYPGIDSAIRDDLANTELLASFLRVVTGLAGLDADIRVLAREAAARISEEIDYVHEAQSIRLFEALYQDHPFIRVPEVIPEASGPRVLTMTYLPGLNWPEARHAEQDLKDTWAEVITRFIFGGFRHSNLLWADPHPGNYRFNPDGTVGFVDFGCVTTVPEIARHNWVSMVRAAIEGRMADARRLMVQVGFCSEQLHLDDTELAEWWTELLGEFLGPQPVRFSPEDTARVIKATFRLDAKSAASRMTVPEHFAMYPRVHVAWSSLCAGLGATIFARAIADDLDGAADPQTQLGKAHHEWVRRRGLPDGLARRDRS
jgi:predicted unusual protein kinase regulating ubiquinone biosynthesis (AarF/ABC1/UbiB family)